MNKFLIYIFLSGLFGLFSILSDQYAYQAEKLIVSTEILQQEEINKLEQFLEINEILIDAQKLIVDYYRLFDLDYNYGRAQEVVESYDISNLVVVMSNVKSSIEEASLSIYFKEITPKNLSTDYLLLSKKVSESSFHSDTFALVRFGYDQLGPALMNAAKLSQSAMNEAEKYFEEIANIRFLRQIAILIAIASSLLSLLFLFLFFKIFLKDTIKLK